jgi:Na+-transporting NADH:ubiquinone oxidoreductase subunit NqrB
VSIVNSQRRKTVTAGTVGVSKALIDGLRHDPRYLVAGFLTLILIVGQAWLGFLESLEQFAIAVVFSMATEITLSRIYRGEWPNPISAYMTGVSVGILVRSPDWWPYAAASVLAISQKYAIQLRERHLFNPSNFGLCILLLAVPATVAALSKQWTNMPGVMLFIFLLGFVVISRLRRLDIVFTYVLGFILLSLVRSTITGVPILAELSPATGPAFQLFIFFMITDPQTTPSTRRGRVSYAMAIAVIEALLRLARNQNAPFLALFVVSPIAIIWETLRKMSRDKT